MVREEHEKNIYRPLISFIMPCYNASKTIISSAESLLKQDQNKLIELIILNDGSTDNNITHKICSKLNHKYKNITYKNLKNNIGQAKARNKGIDLSNGKYIGFLDSDDTLNEELLKNVIKFAKLEKYDVIVWGLTENHYDSKGNISSSVVVVPNEGLSNNRKAIINLAKELEQKYMLGYLWNKVYKRDFLNKHKLSIPNEHLIEDELFNIDIFKKASSVYCIEKSLYKYRRSDYGNDSLTSYFLPDYFQQYYKRINTLYNWFKETNNLDDETAGWLGSQYIRYALSAVWRNKDKRSGMSKTEQKSWIKYFYNLSLTKKLLHKATAVSNIQKFNIWLFKKKLLNLIMLEASVVSFVTKNMSGTMSKLRQSK